jgi:amidase
MPTTLDPLTHSASSAARAIRDRSISSTEVVDACLARIAAVNPQLNAVIHSRADDARQEARAADAAVARGENVGPLHGVPITIKDAFDLAGAANTSGTLGLAKAISSHDATAVARLRAAGAIVLGKTNVPELTLAYETDNLLFGRTNNPYDVSRTPGGSSGGEAAIIASGGSLLGLGTDIGGSIRVPAHYCGIAGLKPTLGRVPTTGVFPPAVGIPGGLYHVGPLARRVDDLALALSVLQGPDGRDPRCVPGPAAQPADVHSLRVAWYTDNGTASPTPETAKAIENAARALQAAGASSDNARPDGAEEAYGLFRGLFAADDSATVQHLLGMIGTSQPSPLLLRLGEILHPFALPTAALAGLLVQVDMFRARMLAFLDRFDVVLSPVTASPAVRHGTSLDEDALPGFSYAMTHSLTGWPAVVVRAGTSAEGLPIGVQVVARPWHEEVALAAARTIEATLGAWPAMPAL